MIKKRILYAALSGILTCFVVSPVAAQEKEITLSGNLSGSHTYTARDAVRLKPGFLYRSSSSQTFSGNIDEHRILPADYLSSAPDINTRSLDLSKPVGSLSGKVDVGASGAAVYQLPLDIPSGIGGVQPSISIAYNSQGGNGLLGWGFSIEGLSAITRVMKTIITDGNSSAVRNNSGDALALDGNRLMYAGKDPLNGAMYRPEIGSSLRITIKNPTLSDQIYYEALSKEGYIYRYGSGSGRLIHTDNNVRTVQAWMLDYVKSPNGQEITYEYTPGNLYTYIRKISYSGNTIEFLYSERADKTPLCYYRSKGELDKILRKIVISSGGQLYRTYDFEYTKDHFSRLVKISTSDDRGELVNPTIFNWGAFSSELYSDPLEMRVNTYYEGKSSGHSYIPVDLNGDGVTDLLHVYASSMDGANLLVDRKINSLREDGVVAFSVTPEPLRAPASAYFKRKPEGFLVGDVYGLGKQNVVLAYYLHNEKGIYFMVIGDDYHRNSPFIRMNYSSELPVIALGDVDNDGKSDFVYIEKGKNNNGKYMLKYSDTGNPYTWITIPIDLSDKPEKIRVTDFDCDGLPDIMVLTSSGYTIFWNRGGAKATLFSNYTSEKTSGAQLKSSYKNVETADFSGHGFPEMIYKNETGNWRILRNNRNRTFSQETPATISTSLSGTADYPEEEYSGHVIDFDGDGRSDVIIQRKDANRRKIFWFRSTGSGFYLQKTVSNNMPDEDYRRAIVKGDFRGRGRSELIAQDYDWLTGSVTGSVAWRLYNPRGSDQEGKVTAIADGMNNKTTLKYAFLSDPGSGYTKDGEVDYPVISIQSALSVVKEMTHTSSVERTILYGYKGAQVHAWGRGFLCFSETTARDLFSKFVTTTQSSHNGWFSYPSSQEISIWRGAKISKTENEYSYHDITPHKIVVPYLQKQTVTDELTGLITQTETEVDLAGNPTRVEITRGDQVEIQSTSYIQAGGWCDAKPSEHTVSWPDETYIRKTTFRYDNKGNLIEETTDPGDVNQVVTSYKDLTPSGQPCTIETTANGVTRRITKSYTPSGRFLAGETDVLGESVTYTWNERKGELLSRQDRLGTTSYSYNRLGQKIGTHYPDGTLRQESTDWATDTSGGKLYYTRSESTGESPYYTWHNAGGQILLEEYYDMKSRKVSVFRQYYGDGKPEKVSAPTFSASATSWDVAYSYDNFGRVTRKVTPLDSTTTEYSGLTTTVTSAAGEKKKTTLNRSGQVEYVWVNGRRVSYTYYPSGRVKTATPESGKPVAMEYDLQGNWCKLTDPDAGTVTTVYDGWGQVLSESQAIHDSGQPVVTTYRYHPSGLPEHKQRGDEKTYYGYDNLNRLRRTALTRGGITSVSQSYSYDERDRLVELRDSVDAGHQFVSRTEYDHLGRVSREIYPSGYAVSRTYHPYGYLTGIRDANGTTLWQALDCNERGQITESRGGSKVTTFGYNSKGLPEEILTPGIVHVSYGYNAKNDLEYRKDNLSGYEEHFVYDPLNRLTDWKIKRDGSVLSTQSQRYSRTNISSRSGFGSDLKYGEGNNKPHALTSFLPETGSNFSAGQQITYTDFKKVKTVTEGNNHLAITYGVDQQRIKSFFTTPSGTVTRYYLGGYEEEEANGQIRKIHYLSGGTVWLPYSSGIRTGGIASSMPTPITGVL